ncbi:unnamed protein product [Blepharisma stoltei]|uniref:Uncharacterized protein n=1 Tax=Blepharisma stoltei TaxID=1481888 RepID=A0AAU9J1L0_9CILI|nr:unnamed protein product [Blepharisma stoltei]
MVLPLFLIAGLLLGVNSIRVGNAETFLLNPNYQVEYFTEPIDHMNRDSGFINIKALIMNGSPSGPVFVYTGGNHPIEYEFQGAGFITEYLQLELNATVIFIEHRYYGDSVPSEEDYQYLTTSQALYDFADILDQVVPSNTTAVIAFGSVYSGMLAAFMRIKYPHIIDGAIASSAPLLAQLDTQGTGFSRVVSYDYSMSNVNQLCHIWITDGFNILSNLISRPTLYTALEDTFHTCQSLNDMGDIVQLQDWLTSIIKSIALYNFPYVSNVYGPLPPWPVNVACQLLQKYNMAPVNQWSTLQGMYEVANLYLNYTGRATCFDIYNVFEEGQPWMYQQCTELMMPMGQYGPIKTASNPLGGNDMFPVRPWSTAQFIQMCQSVFGVTPKPSWISVNYGMSANVNETLQYASNIVFSYGQLDPFKYSCIQDEINPQTTVFYIRNATTAVDLRTPSPNDPQTLMYARNHEEILISQWIAAKASSTA